MSDNKSTSDCSKGKNGVWGTPFDALCRFSALTKIAVNDTPAVSRAAFYHSITDEERQAFIADVAAMIKEYPYTVIRLDHWRTK